MRFSVPGSHFELTLLGYQYPDAEGEQYDANWLIVQVDASGPQGSWTAADPCLLTSEVNDLANWLDSLRAGSGNPAISFLEPVLLFRVFVREGAERFLRVHFGNIIHPSWRDAPANVPAGHEIYLDFPLAKLDLDAAAQDLRRQLKRFPHRREL